jgi:patatin-like phospholipase
MSSSGATTIESKLRRKLTVTRAVLALLVLLAATGLLAYSFSGPTFEPRIGHLAPVPAALADRVTVLGLPNARFWAWYDTQGPVMVTEWEGSLQRERASLGLAADAPLPPAYFMAVSGGGGDGAFGAGLICGWSDSGTLPKFKLVTGVSTGSMIAPFVFLGGPYIDTLRKIYTTISDKDVRTMRALNGLYGVVFSDAMADTTPLYKLISRYVDEQMLADLAKAYGEGRMLLVATANLDQQRPVLWNVGAIAASGHPDALELVRKVILASAAIPAAFPPVMIDVEADGQQYQEMHVDAGVVAQTFLYPSYLGYQVDFRSGAFKRERHAYIIRNSRLDPNWASVNREFLTITQRSIATMIHYLGYNDLLRVYETTKRDGIDFNLAYIGTDFNKPKVDTFDPDYMKALFDYAFEKGQHGYAWHKTPPISAAELTSETTTGGSQ